MKNLSLLVGAFDQAIRENDHLRLILVGDGAELTHMRKQVHARGIESKVVFAGRHSGEALIDHYRAADVFALTSSYDNFPQVVYEAMACELPTVATRVGGVPTQVVDGLTGYLVRPGDSDEFARRLVALANDSALRTRMGRAGRCRMRETASWAASAQALIAHYREIVQSDHV